MIGIALSNRQRSVALDMPWLRAFAKIALGECLKHPAHAGTVLALLENVDVAIVSDKVIADVHWQFMQIEGPTDVITFDHGEIVISAQTAMENAAKYGKPVDHETGLYVIHGLLHLNGYEDKTAAEARRMHKLQNQILDACLKSKDSSS